MTQDKMRKIITACVTAATVLFVLLLSFLIYQWIRIAILNKKIEVAEADVAYWEEKVRLQEDELTDYQDELYLKWAYEELKALEGNK